MTSSLACALILVGGALGALSSRGEQEHSSAKDGPSSGAVITNAVVMRSAFITIPPLFKELDRAPVLFAHDLHTRALKEEGCGACHPKKDGGFTFAFPIKKDERSAKRLMNSFHDACIDCHDKRASKGQKTGPVTCGECHSQKKAYHAREYLPALPQEYDALKDPYHKQCVACHQKSGKTVKEAGSLDWKKFYLRARKRIEIETPQVVYDYLIHDKHQKALEKRCELCHYLAPEVKQKLEADGKQPTGQDWLRQEEEGKSWDDKESAHLRCINCHLQRIEEKKSAGPTACGECHVDRLRPIKDLANIPPPDYADKQRILITFEKATMAGVPFDHKAHIAASRSCGDCHHDTLESCRKCHGTTGTKEGGFITLAEAYHAQDSTWSCVGCHAAEERKPDCAGCHHLRKSAIAGSSCAKCHTGKLESLDQAMKLPDPTTIFPKDLKDELEISTLEKEYEKAKVQHKKIAQKLTEISNGSKLATYFHKDETTICVGCHHAGPVEKGKPVAPCATCHTARNEPFGSAPALLGAYHQACLGCHQKMAYPEKEMPQQCAGCHKEKAKK